MRTRRLAIPFAVAALLAALLPAGALAGHAFPVASLGDIWFQADHAGFLDEAGEPVQEFYFRISNNQVRFEGDEDDPMSPRTGRVFIKLEFRDEADEKLGEASREFEFEVASESVGLSPDHSQLLLMREQTDPRTRSVKIEVEDMNSRKRGLFYMISGKRKNGTAEGLMEPAPFTGSNTLATSDLQFAWEIAPAGEGASFEKNGLDVIPNAARTYGLMQSRVSIYYEVYDRAEADPAGLFILTHDVIGPSGSVVYTGLDTVSVRTDRWGRVFRFDAEGLPAGEYVVRTRVRDLAGVREAVSERSFGLVWGGDAWNRTEQDVLDEARVLYQEDEYERFEQMSSADREVYLEQFWTQHDPSPETRGNELREEFNRRVDYANRQYTAFGRKGMVTDKGRIYIRFGEPDEVDTELVPTRDRQLDQLVEELGEDNITAQNLATTDEFDVRPYEVWNYTSTGYPLFPDREFGTSRTGLRFVFVDETGTGHWVLRYTSDFINY